MLILARSEGQSVLIGEQIVVTVLSKRGGQVRIGIEAPKDILVLRGELADAKALELAAKSRLSIPVPD